MKKTLTVISLALASSVAGQKNNFKIIGHLPEDIKTNIYLIINQDTLKTASSNKAFVFEGYLDSPAKVLLKTDFNCGSKFYIDTSTMEMTTRISRTNDKICLFMKEIKGSSSETTYRRYLDDLHNISKQNIPKIIKEKKTKELITKTIKENPGFILSAKILTTYSQEFGYDWTKNNYLELTDRIKSSRDGLTVKNFLNQYEITKQGNTLPDFVQMGANGQPFEINSLKGNVILIDFWASWCKPCRRENPILKRIYTDYKKDGLQIVGISLDSKEKNWKAAILKDGLTWIQLSDLRGWDNEVCKQFLISSIPFNILVNKEYKIVATNLKGATLEKAIQTALSDK